jgi:hypothetical protein
MTVGGIGVDVGWGMTVGGIGEDVGWGVPHATRSRITNVRTVICGNNLL